MIIRIVAGAALVILALSAPFWIFFVGAGIFSYFFSYPFEIVIIAFVLDTAYYFSESNHAIQTPFIYSIVALLILFCLSILKKKIR